MLSLLRPVCAAALTFDPSVLLLAWKGVGKALPLTTHHHWTPIISELCAAMETKASSLQSESRVSCCHPLTPSPPHPPTPRSVSRHGTDCCACAASLAHCWSGWCRWEWCRLGCPLLATPPTVPLQEVAGATQPLGGGALGGGATQPLGEGVLAGATQPLLSLLLSVHQCRWVGGEVGLI